jgi:hypothetical protein
MKRITVYADFDFLASPQEIGTLGYEHVRGAVKDWRRVASELQIPNKTLAPYCGRWDNL